MLYISEIIDKKVAVHCATEKDAEQFLELCYKAGIKWRSGNYANEFTKWDEYESDTCYHIGTMEFDDKISLMFADIGFYKDNEFMIIDFVGE